MFRAHVNLLEREGLLSDRMSVKGRTMIGKRLRNHSLFCTAAYFLALLATPLPAQSATPSIQCGAYFQASPGAPASLPQDARPRSNHVSFWANPVAAIRAHWIQRRTANAASQASLELAELERRFDGFRRDSGLASEPAADQLSGFREDIARASTPEAVQSIISAAREYLQNEEARLRSVLSARRQAQELARRQRELRFDPRSPGNSETIVEALNLTLGQFGVHPPTPRGLADAMERLPQLKLFVYRGLQLARRYRAINRDVGPTESARAHAYLQARLTTDFAVMERAISAGDLGGLSLVEELRPRILRLSGRSFYEPQPSSGAQLQRRLDPLERETVLRNALAVPELAATILESEASLPSLPREPRHPSRPPDMPAIGPRPRVDIERIRRGDRQYWTQIRTEVAQFRVQVERAKGIARRRAELAAEHEAYRDALAASSEQARAYQSMRLARERARALYVQHLSEAFPSLPISGRSSILETQRGIMARLNSARAEFLTLVRRQALASRHEAITPEWMATFYATHPHWTFNRDAAFAAVLTMIWPPRPGSPVTPIAAHYLVDLSAQLSRPAFDPITDEIMLLLNQMTSPSSRPRQPNQSRLSDDSALIASLQLLLEQAEAAVAASNAGEPSADEIGAAYPVPDVPAPPGGDSGYFDGSDSDGGGSSD